VISGSSVSSGNPGYKSGNTLLIGNEASGKINLLSGIGISDTSGYCFSSATGGTLKTFSITYATDMTISCIVNPSVTIDTFCSTAEPLSKIGSISKVSKFGNGNANDLEDWITIDTSSDSSLTGSGSGGCSFPTFVSLEFLTYKAGYSQNPQDYIVAARRTTKRR
jgi:hypothetical protein